MVINRLIGIVLTIFLMVGCRHQNTASLNGWYIINDMNQINGDAIFTKHDVDVIWLDSAYIGNTNTIVYEIAGKFKPEAAIRLSEFTEKNIGKKLGFVFNGEIITSPVIEQKNDNGGFSIISIPLFTKKTEVLKIYENILIDY